MRQRKSILCSRFWKFWIDIIEKLQSENACIVVEGVHDAKILTNLGVPPERIIVIGANSVETIISIICGRYSSAYIFTDFDRRGFQKAKMLLSALTLEGMRALDLRKVFLQYFGLFGFKSLGKVEELKTFSEIVVRPNVMVLRDLRKTMSVSNQ